MLLSKNMKKYL